MATAKQLPSGAWRVRVYIRTDENGRKIYKSFTHPDKRKCERYAAEYADEHRASNDRSSFGYAADAYIASREGVLSPSTIRGYKNIDKYLKTHYRAFCDLSVEDIDAQTYQAVINDMNLFSSPKTIRNRNGFISSVMKSRGYPLPPIKLPAKVKSDMRIPDIEDVRTLLANAKGTDLEVPILLGAFAPMRRGEICALRIEDIDGNTIHVHRAIVEDGDGNLYEKSPKTYESDRYILMPEDIIQKIREKGYITDAVRPHVLTNRFARLAEKCGLKGIRFHSLRHFCISYLHAKGIPEEYILERGGWESSGSVMKSVYRHTLISEKDRVNQDILAIFSSINREGV